MHIKLDLTRSKSQTRIQYWNTREITDDKNKKAGLKKKGELLYKSVFIVNITFDQVIMAHRFANIYKT